VQTQQSPRLNVIRTTGDAQHGADSSSVSGKLNHFLMAITTDSEKIFDLLGDVTSEFIRQASSFDEEKINTAPYTGSWTAAQVAEHVTKSNIDIEKQLSKEGRPCLRQPDVGVENIKSIFLNFQKKLDSPSFILPTTDLYERDIVLSDLSMSVERLMDTAKKRDLFEIVHHAIFGEVTRLESLYFVVYHTQRHVHQLRRIHNLLESANTTT